MYESLNLEFHIIQRWFCDTVLDGGLLSCSTVPPCAGDRDLLSYGRKLQGSDREMLAYGRKLQSYGRKLQGADRELLSYGRKLQGSGVLLQHA